MVSRSSAPDGFDSKALEYNGKALEVDPS